MCGIAGLLDPSVAALPMLGQMLDRLAHRGPDHSGVWRDDLSGLALGHRRLSIIDLSATGRQPMLSASQRFVLVYNGEIYNHRELRQQLASTHEKLSWRGSSDTEVLLNAIETWGVASAVERCNGMFAFALWDRQTRQLVLARDRMGEKPLYFGWISGRFAFASELKALMRLSGWTPRLHVPAITAFLRTGYVGGFESAIGGVFRLPPACLLSLSLDDLQRPRDAEWLGQRLASYWSLPAVAAHGASHPIDDPEIATAHLESLLREAVAMRMVADVPLGAFLSGGIDSSLITALMQTQSARPVRTFSIGFHEPRFDEAPFARAVATHLATEHTELYVDAQAALNLVPTLSEAFDEPFADASQLPTLLVSQLAGRHVRVALTGDGGDELFAGYRRYAAILALWRVLRPLPMPLRRCVSLACEAAARLTAPFLLSGEPSGSLSFRFARLAERLAVPDIEVMRRSFMGGVGHARILRGECRGAHASCAPQPTHDALHALLLGDQSDYLPDDILFKVDRAAMAYSLETRVPLLDHRVVELSWQFATPHLTVGGVGKQPLRHILEKHLPREMFDRPKQGFSPPMDAWLRGPLREWAEARLSEDSLRELPMLDAGEVRAMWRAHLSQRLNAANVLWNVAMLADWRECYGVTA